MFEPIPASNAPQNPAAPPPRPAIHIISIHAENVKRLKCVDIAPGDGVGAITIGGKNGAGKSSVLDAIQMALAGGKSIPPDPINADAVARGRETGEPAKMTIVATLSNGLVVKRSRRDGGKDYLEIVGADGASYRSPQAILDAMIGDLCFDPLAFTLMPPRDKRATLMTVARLDFTQGDADKATLREALRDAEASMKACEQSIASIKVGTPPEIKDITEMVAAYDRATATAKEHDRLHNNVERARDALAASERARDQSFKRIEELEAMLAKAREDHGVLTKESSARSQAMSDAKEALRLAGSTTPDLNVMRATIDRARDDNRTAEIMNKDIERRQAFIIKHGELEQSVSDIKEAIKAIEQERVTRLQETKYPVDGLGLSDDGLTYNGRPLEQASQAEQLRVSVAMSLAMKPDLRVMLVRQGALLDNEHLELLSQMAADAGAQVWVERVGDDGTCAVVMEDGGVLIDRMNGSEGDEPAAASK